jgi:hypothetical protein
MPLLKSLSRCGELTRGMLVVDRREDEGAYELGANRADTEKVRTQPALVEVEEPPLVDPVKRKVRCIVRTPGPASLLKLMLQRIWGVY